MNRDIDADLQDGFAANGRIYEVFFALSQERVRLREQVQRLEDEKENLLLQLDACQGALGETLEELADAREEAKRWQQAHADQKA